MKELIKLCLAAAISSGCTYSVHQVALGNFDDLPPNARLRPIEAQAAQKVFVAAGDTDFADEAMRELAARCPRGQVVGIQARHSTSLGFFVYTNKLKLSGYCVEAPSTAAASNTRAVVD
ncbi:MAG TPA: hypothetical protein VHB79_05020 [Polyangiaceae bacterium]|nr:hypothetical protein [Polyangiaceae bacterium]